MNKLEAVSIETSFCFERRQLWEQFSFSELQGTAYAKTAACSSEHSCTFVASGPRSQVPSSPEP